MTKKLLALASAMQVEFESGPKFRNEYHYQSTRTAEEVFNAGGSYFCIQKNKPTTEVDGVWVKHPDQFWLEFYKCPAGLTIWMSDEEYGERLTAHAQELLEMLDRCKDMLPECGLRDEVYELIAKVEAA